MSQLAVPNSHLDLRTQLHQMVLNDLLGPAGDENEELDEDTVRSRYIVGNSQERASDIARLVVDYGLVDWVIGKAK